MKDKGTVNGLTEQMRSSRETYERLIDELESLMHRGLQFLPIAQENRYLEFGTVKQRFRGRVEFAELQKNVGIILDERAAAKIKTKK